MAIRERLNHVAAGMASAFIGRNNDLDGYWAPGLMYRELTGSSPEVVLDLLDGSARPGLPDCTRVACRYAALMRLALAKKGLQPAALAHASVHVRFNAATQGKRSFNLVAGEPFAVTVILRTGDREARCIRESYCKPFAVGVFTRSVRTANSAASVD